MAELPGYSMFDKRSSSKISEEVVETAEVGKCSAKGDLKVCRDSTVERVDASQISVNAVMVPDTIDEESV